MVLAQIGDNTEDYEDERLGGNFSYSVTSTFPPRCYHCDFSIYETKQEYEYHCVLRHAGKPAYPGPADIKESGLTAQGMSWEKTATR